MSNPIRGLQFVQARPPNGAGGWMAAILWLKDEGPRPPSVWNGDKKRKAESGNPRSPPGPAVGHRGIEIVSEIPKDLFEAPPRSSETRKWKPFGLACARHSALLMIQEAVGIPREFTEKTTLWNGSDVYSSGNREHTSPSGRTPGPRPEVGYQELWTGG